jgi:hypothetical protein
VSVNGHEPGDWVFLPDAARRLGRAPQTIRRKLKRGELESRQVPTRTGLAYQVRLVDDQPLPGQASLGQPTHETVETTRGLVELVQLVRDLQAEVTARTEAAAVWQARAEFLAGEVRQLRAALEAPKAEPAAPEPPPDAEAIPGPATRPWWRRAWSWLGAGWRPFC